MHAVACRQRSGAWVQLAGDRLQHRAVAAGVANQERNIAGASDIGDVAVADCAAQQLAVGGGAQRPSAGVRHVQRGLDARHGVRESVTDHRAARDRVVPAEVALYHRVPIALDQRPDDVVAVAQVDRPPVAAIGDALAPDVSAVAGEVIERKAVAFQRSGD